MALSVAEVGDFTREYGTYIGDLKVLFNNIVKITLIFKGRFHIFFKLIAKNNLTDHLSSTSRISKIKIMAEKCNVFQAHSHGIRGHVYIVDKNHLYIRKFSYDGGGSLDAYFWVSFTSSSEYLMFCILSMMNSTRAKH